MVVIEFGFLLGVLGVTAGGSNLENCKFPVAGSLQMVASAPEKSKPPALERLMKSDLVCSVLVEGEAPA